jgi:hypothetical protein
MEAGLNLKTPSEARNPSYLFPLIIKRGTELLLARCPAKVKKSRSGKKGGWMLILITPGQRKRDEKRVGSVANYRYRQSELARQLVLHPSTCSNIIRAGD